MRKCFVFSLLLCLSGISVYAQNYTSVSDGQWTTASNWNNTSGWGSATPSTTGGHGSGTAVVAHDLTISGDYNLASATVNINAGKTLTVTGNFSKSGGGSINISGTLIINGNVDLNGPLNIRPGGQVFVHGTLTLNSSNYLTIGTSTAPPPYADLIVYQDVISLNSGDIAVNRNGRVAAFGDVTATGGGTLFTISNGGQVYVDGDINFSGGGSHINNNNTSSPYGLYVKGGITNSGGGSGTTTNYGDEETMEDTNPDFYDWVATLPGSPLGVLPITLLYFDVAEINTTGIALKWATSLEKDFDHFLVERSSDGFNFEPVAKIQGRGESQAITEYSTVDPLPKAGKNYYRLKNVDLDGSYEYSRLVMAQWNGSSNDFNVYPNPAVAKTFTIQSNEDFDRPVKMALLNSTGQVVFQTELTSFSTRVELPESIEQGVYIVKLNSTSYQKAVRLVVK